VRRRDHTHAWCLHAVHHAFGMQWHSNERRDLLVHGSLKAKNTDLQHQTSIKVRGRHTVWHAFGGTRVVMYCFVCTHGLRTSYDVCMNIYIYTHTYIRIYICIIYWRTMWYAFGGTHVVMYCFVCTHGLRTSYDVCMNIYIYIYTHTYIRIYICIIYCRLISTCAALKWLNVSTDLPDAHSWSRARVAEAPRGQSGQVVFITWNTAVPARDRLVSAHVLLEHGMVLAWARTHTQTYTRIHTVAMWVWATCRHSTC
jgi:hypothetical protein